MPKTVTLSDGTIVRNVPDDVTQEELEERIVRKSVPTETVEQVQEEPTLPQEEEKENIAIRAAKGGVNFVKGLREETARVLVGGIAEPALNTMLDLRGIFQSEEDQVRDRIAGTAAIAALQQATDPDLTSQVTINPETQDIEAPQPETFAGTVAPYLIASNPVYRGVSGAVGVAGLTGRTASAARLFGTGGVVEQFLSDPYATAFDALDETFNKDQKIAVLNFLAADEGDSEAERRLKLAFQDVVFTSAFVGITGIPSLIRKIGGETGEKFLKGNLKDITKEETSGFMVDLVKEIKRTPGAPQLKAAKAPVAQGLDQSMQVEKQALHGEGPIRRIGHWAANFYRQAGTVNGFLTPNAFRAKQQSLSSRRSILQHAEDIGMRMNSLLKEASEQASTKEGGEAIIDNVRNALKGDSAARKALPRDLRDTVDMGRDLIDRMSNELIDNPMVTKELKETINENVGEYLTRSYRLFEDASYRPSSTAYQNAVNEQADAILKSKARAFIDVKDYDEALKLAKGEIDNVLGKGREEYINFKNGSERINHGIFKRKKNLTPAMRELLGEITDPSSNLVITVDNMSQLLYKSRWYEAVERLGKGKYLFDSPQGVYTVPVQGTGSWLDFTKVGKGSTGYYTSPEMLKALKGQEFHVPQWSTFSFIKGLSQKSKTVWSHPTHMKNLLGGFGFRMANGYSPFSENSEKAFKTVMDNIKSGGDEGWEKAYRHYLDLGIINTNVRVGEFRRLIEDGASKSGPLIDKLVAASDKIHASGAAGKVLNAADRIYMGTDDYFKINTFLDYTQTIKEAFPQMTQEAAERHAASVIRDVIPNYDLVPNAIKELRNLPIGNFAGFSSEMMRTSVNIAKLAYKEMTSGNPVLAERGLARALGFGTMSLGGVEMGARLSQELAGLDTDESQAAFVEAMGRDWSKNPTVFARRGEDGQLYGLDMSTLNPYDYVYKPVFNLAQDIMDGIVKEDDVDNILADGVAQYMKDVLEPFTGEAIAFEPIRMAISGELLKEPGESGTDYGFRLLDSAWGAIEPGTISALRRYNEAAQGKRQEPLGEPRDLVAEVDMNFSGMRWTPIRPVETVVFGAGQYQKSRREITSMRPDFTDSPQTIRDKFRRVNREHYEIQAELHRKVDAAISLGMSPVEAARILKSEGGLTDDEATSIILGTYKPPFDVVDLTNAGMNKAFIDDGKSKGRFESDWLQLQRELAKDQVQMYGLPLTTFKNVQGRPEGAIDIVRSGKRE